MATKLSQIAVLPPTSPDDQVVGVITGTTDALFAIRQIGTILLTANLDLYVSPSGSNSNPGTIGSPYATLGFALQRVSYYDYADTFNFTIHLADGTYPENNGFLAWVIPQVKNAPINCGNIVGNHTTPGNVVFSDAPGFSQQGAYQTIIDGMRLIGSTGTGGMGFFVVPQGGGNVSGGVGAGIFHGNIIIDTTNQTNCNFMVAQGGGVIDYDGFLSPVTLTVQGTQGGSFARAASGGVVNVEPDFLVFPASYDFQFSTVLMQFGAPEIVWATGATTNGAGVTGFIIDAQFAGAILTINGVPSDIPGSAGQFFVDNSIMWRQLVGATNPSRGFATNPSTTIPLPTDIPQNTWGFFKDTTVGGVYAVVNDGGVIKDIGQPLPLSANLTLYVATTGSDNNPGTSGSKFLTLQRALREVVKYDYLHTYSWTINIADGTYPETDGWTIPAVTNPIIQGGNIIGNNTTPANVNFSNAGAMRFNPATYQCNIGGIKLTMAGGGPCYLVANGGGAPGAEGGIVFVGDFTVDTGSNFSVIFCSASGALFDNNGLTNVNILGSQCLTVIQAESGSIQAWDGPLNFKFPVAYTIFNVFMEIQTAADVTWSGITLTNDPGGDIYGSRFASISTDNGVVSDIPGGLNFSDGTLAWRKIGSGGWSQASTSVAGLPTTTQLPSSQTWGIFKDTSGGEVYIAFNDAGTIKALAPATARVTTQFDKTNDTTLANIPGLVISVGAGLAYQFVAVLFTASNVATGVKASVKGTCTATAIIYEGETTDAGAIAAQTRATALGTAVGGVTAVTAARIDIMGLIKVNAAGTLTIQFAQNTAVIADVSSVLVGSYMSIQQVP